MTTLLFGGHFITSKDGKTGLVDVTIRITRVTLADGTLNALVTDAACVEDTAASKGGYLYRLTGADLTTYNYIGYMSTADSTVDQQCVAAMWVQVDSTVNSIADNAITADAIATDAGGEIADAVHDEVIEGTLTLRQMLRIFLASLAGKATGGDTTTITVRDNADTKARITATVDDDGNRTAITLDGS
jgi:hypothetical protein